MNDIENLPQDAGIALILQRLKDSKPEQPIQDDTEYIVDDEDNVDNCKKDILDKRLISSETDVKPISLSQAVMDRKNDPQVSKQIKDAGLSDESILPWFLITDKDQKSLHYITFDDSGKLVYNTTKTDRPANDLASLKLRDNYVCDLDYYKSRHFVLCVKQFESNYECSRSFSKLDEALKRVSELDDNTLNLEKTSSDEVSTLILNSDKYWHYVVFTDLGVADFIVKQDDVHYPYDESNLSKWFEEVSNYNVLKNANYTPHVRSLLDESDMIKEFKYDIITMHVPGVITLDSIDNEDPDYKVHIKLKDVYNYIPLNRLLKCLKYYATHNEKTFNDFKLFINQYFDVVAI